MAIFDNLFIITDLDGTLLSSDKNISSEDVSSLRYFQQFGGAFSFATGRTLQAAKQYIDFMHITAPVILFNGAAIYDPVSDSVLYKKELPIEAVSITKQVLKTFPYVSAEILRIDGTYVPRMTPCEEEHLKMCKVEPIISDLESIPYTGWLKVLFAIDPNFMKEFIAFFDAKQWGFVDFVQSESRFYEMLPKNVTKGSALRVYRNLPKWNAYHFIAVGDYDNDLELILEADHSACPANAQECIKNNVDFVLKSSCESSALSELVDHIKNELEVYKNG